MCRFVQVSVCSHTELSFVSPLTGSLRPVAAGEPSASQLEKFATLSDVTKWTQMSPDVSGPFFQIMGATGQEPPRMLWMMEVDEVLAETSKMTIGDSLLTSLRTRDVEGRLEKAEKEAGKLTAAAARKHVNASHTAQTRRLSGK